MPVPLRTAFQKAEAKYNVTTEFPSLGLHSAAATGNVGLVEYALDHGQPVNSVLDGVLPLHAACAGGNVQVVKVLIDHGADVNAPRLPRKYSNDKNRDSSAPIVGTSGSTPLHFAAANGNTEVVSLLLLHGAHVDRADKHGVTPEMLALQNGWIECAKLLRNWIMNKDRDLREREGFDFRAAQDNLDPTSSSPRRRLHVKQSIDTALNMLKSTDPQSKASRATHTPTPPGSPIKPFGEYTFHPVDPENDSVDINSRRPSLPYLPQPHSHDSSRNRRPSATSSSEPQTQRRPRSAGNGADQKDQKEEQEVIYPVYGRGGSGRRLGSKYSLLNIFKKAQPGDGSDSNIHTPDIPSAGPVSTVTLPLPGTVSHSASASSPNLPENFGQPSTAPARSGFFHRGSDASTRGRLTPQTQTTNLPSIPRKPSGNLQTPPRPNLPLALELHLALAQQQQRAKVDTVPGGDDDGDNLKAASPLVRLNPLHNRNRSASASSGPLETNRPYDEEKSPTYPSISDSAENKASPSPRPGILRAHNRTSSNGQSSPLNSRTLRFDSSSSTPASERKGRESPRTAPPALRSQSSTGSLTKLHIQTNHDTVDANSESNQAALADLNPVDNDLEADQEENYGQAIESGALDAPSVLLQRQRGLSFGSSSESSLSPILTNDSHNDLNSDFPFSINRPLALPLEEDQVEELPSSFGRLNVPTMADGRGRGDSLSSNSTSDSRSGALMSSSGSGTSMTISTPGITSALLLPVDSDKSLDQTRYLDATSGDDEGLPSTQADNANINSRRSHTPLDIDISNISSHAQAEALVQRARKEALELAGAQEISSAAASSGRSPLSARLAAYGESLALERKLREQKASEDDYWKERVHDPMPTTSPASLFPPNTATPRQRSREGIERHLSLENKSPTRPRKAQNGPRRPSTAEGVTSTRQPDSFFRDRAPSHHSSRSASAFNPLPHSQDINIQTHPSKRDAIHEASMVPEYSQPSQPQSHAPNNPSEEPLSRINSTDDADTETDSALTVQRTATVPINSTKKSAKKLARMGYPVAEQAAAASRTAATATPSTPPTSKRFGIKSLMQTFKGKA